MSGSSLQLEQVFINLFQNSIDSLDGRKDGRITIAMCNEQDRQVIRFSDNGAGVPCENKNKIFEPFFTTKEMGKGTGLGLAISYGIISDHNGTIICESKAGHGTTFTISLPLAGQDQA